MSFNDICEFFIFEKHMNYYLTFVSVIILLIIYYGYYHNFAIIISNLVKQIFNIKNDNPYVSIITFIIKIIVFIKVLNYFLKSALNSIFVNIYDVPKNKEQYCTRQLIISKISNLTSTTFFIVYYFFTLPHNIILSIDDFYYTIVKLFDMVLKNDERKEALNKSAKIMDDIRIKIDEILNIYYEDLNYHLGGGILSFITNTLLSQLGDSNEGNMKDLIRDKIASSYAGYLSISIPFILGCFYLLLYNLMPGSYGLRFILFMIICYFYFRSSIQSFALKVATKNLELLNSMTRAIANKENRALFKDLHNLVCEEGKEFSIFFSPVKKLLKYVCNAKELEEIRKEIKKDLQENLKKNSIKTNTPKSSHKGLIKSMDKYNKKATEEFIEHVFKHPETGKQMSYSEMRNIYG